MLRIFQLNLRWRIERKSMKWKIFAICLRLSRACCSFIHQILAMSLDFLESCVFIRLCSLTFFSFSAYAEVWRVRLDWTLQWRLSLAWRSHIWFHDLTLCELDLLVNLTSRSRIICISLFFVLRVCRNWIEFSSQQALEILTHVESLVSTLYSSAFNTRANLLRSLCFVLL